MEVVSVKSVENYDIVNQSREALKKNRQDEFLGPAAFNPFFV